MDIDRAQFQNIQQAVGATALTPSEAELVVAIAKLAVAADRVDDPEEQRLFDQLAGHLYSAARVSTSPPVLDPIDDDEARREQLRTHGAQLLGKPAGSLAYALSYILTIADLDLAEEEIEIVDLIGESVGLSPESCDELAATVSALVTPAE